MKRRILPLALAAALLMGGCSTPPPLPTPSATSAATPVAAEQTGLTLPCYPAAGFHPITGTNRLNLALAPLLYRGLFAIDRHFQPINELCREYTVSEDGRIWTFYLVDATFSDGSALTAKEAVDSLNAARRSERYKERLSGIQQVAEEGGAVSVTLSRPNGALPSLLDVPIIKESEDPDRPLGTGDHYLKEEADALSLQAREGAQTPLKEIRLYAVEASDDLIYAFDAGEISLVDTDLTSTNALGYSGRFETTDYPTTALVYVGCNTKTGACREPAVRQAVARAADRKTMAGRLLAGHGVDTALPIHPGAKGYNSRIAAKLDYDKQAAAALLEEAGWKPEEGKLRRGRNELTIKLIVNQDNTSKVKMAESLGAQLQELGCTVSVESLPWEDFNAALRRGDFDLYLGETLLTADFDPEILLTGALNYGGFADEETSRLLGLYQAASGEERERAAGVLWARMVETLPIIPLCFKNGSLLTQWGQVSGATPTQRDVFAGLENWSVKHS